MAEIEDRWKWASLEQRNCHNASKLNWNKPEHVLIDAVLNAKHFYTPTDKIDSFRACVFLDKCQKSVKICSKYAIFAYFHTTLKIYKVRMYFFEEILMRLWYGFPKEEFDEVSGFSRQNCRHFWFLTYCTQWPLGGVKMFKFKIPLQKSISFFMIFILICYKLYFVAF